MGTMYCAPRKPDDFHFFFCGYQRYSLVEEGVSRIASLKDLIEVCLCSVRVVDRVNTVAPSALCSR